MKFLRDLFYKAIAKISGDNTILWEKGILGRDDKHAKVSSPSCFKARLPIVVTKNAKGDFVYTVYDMNTVWLESTHNDKETYSEVVFPRLHAAIHAELRELDQHLQPPPKVTSAEEILTKVSDVVEIKYINVMSLFA